MCGIIGYVGAERAEAVVADALKRMEYRGYDSAGYALLDRGGLLVNKDAVRVRDLPLLGVHSGVAIGHTRWATHGKPTAENAHPHLSQDGKIAIVHNGIVENADSLKAKLTAEGVVFRSQTDSEVIAHLVAKYYAETSDTETAVRCTVADLDGAFSFVALNAREDGVLYCYRRRTSLLIGFGNGEMLIASDMLALAPYAESAHILSDDELGIVRKDGAEVSRFGKRVELRPVPVCAERVDLNEKCFMEKEISEIPLALRRTYRSVADGLSQIPDEVFSAADDLFICACGTAYHAGLFAKRAFSVTADRRAVCVVASEASEELAFVTRKTLAVFVSQSGETSDTLGALRRAKARGATTLAVTNVRGSSISFEADFTLYTDAGAEIAVAATKSYNSQLLALYMLVLRVKAVDCGKTTDLDASVERLILAAQGLVNLDCERVFSEFAEGFRYFFIGRGSDLVTAREGALKMKEITYSMTDAYPSGELKHGTIALIDSHALVTVVLTSEADREKTKTAISELRSRGAKIMLITSLDGFSADVLLPLPQIYEELLPVLAVIPLQRFALFVARARGLDPDKPRNLAKSVTVD